MSRVRLGSLNHHGPGWAVATGLSVLVAGLTLPAVAGCGPGGQGGPGGPGRSGGPVESGGWTVTVYYTAVQRYHHGPPVPVTGCRTMNCRHGRADLGRYPADFVAAVREEGTGRTADDRYLNWSHDTGFWLDDAPRDAYGRPLVPFRSAAADPDVLARGSGFRIVDCGREPDGNAIDPAVCDRMRQATWTVTDQFTPGYGGPRHLDVYIGEETGPDFTDSPWYCTMAGARLRTG